MTILHIQKSGKDLTSEELSTINSCRISELNSRIIWNQNNINAFGADTIFMIKDECAKEILAIARLKKISVWINKNEILIWGLSTVIALKKGQGYGKMVIQDIEKYIDSLPQDEPRKLLIGFCTPKNRGFYLKCGIGILPQGSKQFIYINEEDKREINTDSDDILFYPAENEVLNMLQMNSDLEVLHHVSWW